MNTWLNGIMGVAVGDALGTPVQFCSRNEIRNRDEGPVTGMEGHGTYDMPVGTWSDDTSMSLATLDSIRELGKVDPEDIMKRFVEWEEDGKYTPFGFAFDEGNACSFSIYAYECGTDIYHCGKTGEHANGNGALMRILPVCLYQIENKVPEEEAIYSIHKVTALTHNHLRAKIACGMYYYMAKSIIESKEKTDQKDIKELLQEGIDNSLKFYGSDSENHEELGYYEKLFHLDEFENLPERLIIGSGYVVRSIEAAVWCLITSDSLEKALLKAVNLGDDTDSVAAIAGGLAGLYYGYEGIPKDWLKVLQRREWIEEMCAEKVQG